MIGTRWLKVYHDLFDNKARLFLNVMSIAVGVIAFGGMFAARENMLSNLSTQFYGSNPVDVTMTTLPFDDSLVNWASKQEFVLHAEGVATNSVRVFENGDPRDTILHAYDFANVAINHLTPELGKYPPGPGEVVVERSHLAYLKWQIGDMIPITITDANSNEKTYNLRLVGTLHDLSVLAGNITSQLHLYVSTRTLSDLGLSSNYNQLLLTIDRDQLAQRGLPLTTVSQNLRDKLTQRGVYIASINVENPPKYWAQDPLKGLSAVLMIVGFVSLLLSGFLIINTISGIMAQQKRHIGIMKIIGASRRQIVVLYLSMMAAYGLMALIIAIPASIGLAYGIAVNIARQINLEVNFAVSGTILLFEVAAALCIPLLAALVPVLNGTRISAAQAISDYVVSSETNPIDVFLAKIRGLPRPLLLSLRSVFRRKARLAITLTTLILAGAFFLAILNMQEAVPREVRTFARMANYDVEVIFDTPYDADGLLRRALEVPGVVSGETWRNPSVSRFVEGSRQNKEFVLYGVPANSMFIKPTMTQGHWLEPETGANRYDVVVSDELLKTETNVKVGDTLKLNYHGKTQDWHVVGIVDTDGIIGTLTGTTPAYAYYDSVTDYVGTHNEGNLLLLHTQDQSLAGEKAMATRLKEYFEFLGMRVQRTMVKEEMITDALNAFQTVISVLLVTAIMIAVVGGLGLASTMSLSVLERTREIGVMRSIGAETNTLRFMFIAEGVIVGLISFAVASLLSIPTSYGFSDVLGVAMFERPIGIWVNTLGPFYWLGIILVISTAASLLPAHRASQISIREALTYE